MKSFFRNAALALSVLSLGIAVRPVSIASPTKTISACPVPTCPPSDPNGCGILNGTSK